MNHSYQRVLDRRKRPVRRLWRRGLAFYVQARVKDLMGRARDRRIRLQATDVAGAIEEMQKLLANRKTGSLSIGRRPLLADYLGHYLERVVGSKRASTLKTEAYQCRHL